MVTITMVYEGDLHCAAIHQPSGTALATDAPVDNKGRGASFSPTDLVATALGTCVLTTMAIVAETLGVAMHTATAEVTKEMSKTPPRRIAALATTVRMPAGIAPEHRERLTQAAKHCPVHQSLHPDISAPITFEWA